MNYEYEKLNEFTARIEKEFKNIDLVIEQMQAEKDEIEKELFGINTTKNFTSKLFKRKTELPRILKTVDGALQEALAERRKIQESKWQEISNEASNLRSEYSRFIDEQLVEQEKEVDELLKEAHEKIKQIGNARVLMNQNFNQLVVVPTNEAVKVHTNKSKVLSPSYGNGYTKTIQERVEKMK